MEERPESSRLETAPMLAMSAPILSIMAGKLKRTSKRYNWILNNTFLKRARQSFLGD